MKTLKDYQTLIAGLALAASVFTASVAVLRLSFRFGQAVAQHEQIIGTQTQIQHVLNEKCR